MYQWCLNINERVSHMTIKNHWPEPGVLALDVGVFESAPLENDLLRLLFMLRLGVEDAFILALNEVLAEVSGRWSLISGALVAAETSIRNALVMSVSMLKQAILSASPPCLLECEWDDF